MPTSPTTPRRLRSALIGLGWMLASAAPALAQQSRSLRPPAPREDPSAPVVMTILVLVAIVGATLFVAALPSKRGHQD
ncbi:MAG: hypothetical protein ACIARR_07505 [Phycisphaerales bacterium JB059]